MRLLFKTIINNIQNMGQAKIKKTSTPIAVEAPFTAAVKSVDGEIITFDGSSALKSECTKIDNKWYRIGNPKVKGSGQCYIIPWNDSEGTKVRATNNQLIWDELAGTYCQKSAYHVNGLVAIDKNEEVFGWFIPKNKLPINYQTIDGRNTIAISSDIFKNTNVLYHPTAGYYTLNLTQKAKQEILSGRPREKFLYSTFQRGIYNFSELGDLSAFMKTHSEEIKNLQPGVFDRFFGNRTFGTEIETCIGSIPEHILAPLGIVPLHDGSITGHEYVTTVFNGQSLIQKLERIFDAAIENTRANEFCSLHYHIGNVRTDAEFLVAFYQLYYRIQGEIDLLNPLYKRDATYFATKREGKDHCKALPDLGLNEYDTTEEAFKTLLKFYHEGQMPQMDQRSKLYVHVKHGRPKWEHHGRYYALNYLPTLFESKRTIEFRVPSGTVNKYKGINWLFIFNAMLTYCESNIQRIMQSREKILLKDVLQQTYCDGSVEGEFLFDYLMSYITHTKAENRKAFAQRELFGDHFLNDHKYRFEIGGVSPFNFKK